ncbi:hypothetical protein [Ureibacillus sinduriensis]|uniref:hypothetical protein n=1 Tax=Ureibacillus sinduriensis TaxID=561440 RepID=UPI00068AB6DB|nr:hypothetical protein [Ureibacillus sinduriensis]
MNELLELEYRGLSIMEEIRTVEIAIDEPKNIIHIYDKNEVIEPEFNFSTKQYQLGDGFFKMAEVLYKKTFFESKSQTVEQWINEWTWLFYGSKKSILKYEGVSITEIPKEKCKQEHINHPFYNKYLVRVL